MNANTAATLAGGVIAVATAAQPVLNGVQGAMHTQDWMSLAIAAATALFGWFTKFKATSAQ